VFENTIPRRIFGRKRDDVTEVGENCIMRSFVIYALRQVKVKEDKMDRVCSTNVDDEECIWDIGGKVRIKEPTRKTKT
jgi:hypothetical protein